MQPEKLSPHRPAADHATTPRTINPPRTSWTIVSTGGATALSTRAPVLEIFRIFTGTEVPSQYIAAARYMLDLGTLRASLSRHSIVDGSIFDTFQVPHVYRSECVNARRVIHPIWSHSALAGFTVMETAVA